MIEANPNLVAWVTGATGLIGNYLVAQAARHSPALCVVPLTRTDLDLLDSIAVRRKLRESRPGILIHCAGLTRTNLCQADPPLARRLNVEVTRLLVELTADSRFVFLSTDLVFDGHTGGYREDDKPNPLSVYAESKVLAEEVVAAHPRHLIIRTSLNGGTSPSGDRGFNEELRRAWADGRTTTLFTDEFRSPIHASETARAIWKLCAHGAKGVYHVAGSERLSRWEIGEMLAMRWPHLHPNLQAASLKSYSGPPRAPDTSLDCSKAQALLDYPLPGLRGWLAANPDEPF